MRTRYRVLERLGPCALLEIELLTGRTHQIRVHMSEAGTPWWVMSLVEEPC